MLDTEPTCSFATIWVDDGGEALGPLLAEDDALEGFNDANCFEASVLLSRRGGSG